ncbi:MAG TPA: ABC transporter ATP-binding protein [Longimicrobiales bacterium]|nr:ABC transporter ATP-binding protein [Longimicrobiales bacterium]
MSALLAAEGLGRRYGARTVVDVHDLAARRGEVLAVLGPNGAGKSTLFRLLLLLEAPDTGRVLLDGRAVRPGDEGARRRMAGVFQRPHLFAGTVLDNLRFGLRATGVPRAEWAGRIGQAAEEMGVAALLDAGVARLSGGETQRVALARALVLHPAVLLLDEPTANLDAAIRRRFREELGSVLRERAGAVVLITHEAPEAFDLADRVAVMEDGRIVQLGTPEDLTTDPATPFIAAFTGAELLLDGVVEAVEEGTLRVRASGAVLATRGTEPPLRPGERVHVRYRPEDVTLAPAEAPDVSARNRLRMRVRSVTPAGGLIRVRLEGPVALAALITRDSADRLGVAPGAEVTALLKTTALHVYAAHR